MRAVLDAGPLIHLSWLNRLDLLNRLFDAVLVPRAVLNEVLATPTETPGMSHIQRAVAESWWTVHTPASPVQHTEQMAAALGAGETEAILLAEALGSVLLLTDDALARREAMRRRLPVVGTVGVLMEARDRNLLPAVHPLLLELRSRGQWLSDDLVELVREDERNR